MSILSKFNRICFNYSCRLSSNEHAAAFVDEVRQMIQEHEQPSPAPAAGILDKLNEVALQVAGDYPSIEECEPWEKLYAIRTSYEGSVGAIDDLHKVIDKLINMVPAAWQPIATAPRDGKRILAFDWDNDITDVVSWSTSQKAEYAWCDSGAWPFDATHWQPLPAPPQADEVCECGGTGSIPRGLDMWDRMDGEEIPCPKCTSKAAEVTG